MDKNTFFAEFYSAGLDALEAIDELSDEGLNLYEIFVAYRNQPLSKFLSNFNDCYESEEEAVNDMLDEIDMVISRAITARSFIEMRRMMLFDR